MNRVKILALTLLLAVSCIGAGYAYWNESIVISSTVSTGELKVVFENIDDGIEPDYPYIDYNGLEFPELRENNYLSNDDHTLIAGFNNVFPGLYYSIPFEVRNKGTIPATFRQCTVKSEMNVPSGESSLISQLNENLKIKSLFFRVFDSAGHAQFIKVVNGTSINLGELESKINTALNGFTLNPGQNLQATDKMDQFGGKIKFLFSSDFGNDFQNREFKVIITLDWKQFNESN